MSGVILSGVLMVVVATVVGLVTKHFTKNRALAQLAMMLTAVGMLYFFVAPAFMAAVGEIADRRVTDSQVKYR